MNELWDKIVAFWNKLPKTFRVIPYVVAAAALAEAARQLSLIQVDDKVMMAIINVAIVCLVELSKGVQPEE